MLSSPPSPSSELLHASHPWLAFPGKAAEGGRTCRELERLSALREEAQALGKAWFAKLT